MRIAVTVLAAVLGAAAVLVTLLPLSPSNAWWVRMWEFPRLHVAVAGVAVLIAAPFVLRPLRAPLIVAMLAVAGYQASWVVRYTPLVAPDVPIEDGPGATFVALNVLQSNEGKARVADYLDGLDADLVLLIETDAAWAAALDPVLDRYPHRAERIADDNYGMIVATRLDARRIELVETHGGDHPTAPIAVAVLEVDGHPLVFTGLHPYPPIPRFSQADRDRQIAIAARMARIGDSPAVAMGDFNDVAWSRSSQHFREVGGYLDPRVGRGVMASFDTASRLMRFPIDQGLVTEGVTVRAYEMGPDVGSDHFPVVMSLSVGDAR